MQTQGAFTIILNEDNKILLAKRRDYPIWDLPGGRIGEGELAIDCAVRETNEETGYEIQIDGKVGIYHRPDVGDIQHLFVGKITGGVAIIKNEETRKLKFYHPTKLPLLMVPHRKQQIHDWLSSEEPVSSVLKDDKQMISLLKSMIMKRK